jgi:large conductance mechanosensitive channel
VKRIGEEFREFISRGNVVDLAVGIVIGGAFSSVVRSLVDDLLMPPIGLLINNVDFSQLFWVLRQGSQSGPPYATVAAAQEAGAVTVNYGQFINNLVSFVIMALAVFLVIRVVNRLQRAFEHEEAKAEEGSTTKTCPFCWETVNLSASRCSHCTSRLEAGVN